MSVPSSRPGPLSGGKVVQGMQLLTAGSDEENFRSYVS